MAVVLLIAATIGAYWPALQGGFLWDDDAHVTRSELRSFDGLRRIWLEPGATQQYYPLLHSLFWLEHRLWGDAPVGYHVANVLLHLGAAFLLWRLLARLAVPGAWLAAGIFALHPVAVESVAWISEQKNTLSTVFYLAAAIAYLRFDERRERRWYAIASGAFAAALLTKSVTATLPAALLVVLWLRRGRLAGRRDFLPLAPWFAVAITSGLLTAWVEQSFVGAKGEEWSLTFLQRVLLAGRAVWFYASKLVFPGNLTFIYPRFDLDPNKPAQYLLPFLVALVLLGLWMARRRGRAPLAVGLLFVGTLFPALGFFDVYPFRYSFVADHFQYLAMLAPIAGFAAGLTLLSAKWKTSLRHLPATLLLGVLGVLTFLQSGMYGSAEALYSETLQRNPDCWLASNNLGLHLVESGRAAEAVGWFEHALRQRPGAAEVHANLADALRVVGRDSEAMEQYREALRIEPSLASAASSLGNLLRVAGRTGDAIVQLEQALRAQPASAGVANNLGAALADRGRWTEAIELYQRALRLRPGFAEAENNLGTALVHAGRASEAIPHYEAALRARPDFASAAINLGNALVELRRGSEAVAYFERVLQLDPRSAEAENGMGVALASSGRPADAIAHFENALRLRPGYARAEANLGQALLDLGRTEEAIDHYRAAASLQPRSVEMLQRLGAALVRFGRREEAVASFADAARIEPDDPDVRFNLALALLGAGRREEGVAQLREALRRRPDHPEAKALLAVQAR